MKNYTKYIEENTLRVEASGRGGGIEIDCEPLTGIEGARMSAYQNYLGGGMLGRICSDQNFTSKRKEVSELEEALKQYFHKLTNHVGDEWEEQSYIQNQNMPESAY